MNRRAYIASVSALMIAGGVLILSAFFAAMGQLGVAHETYADAWRMWWAGCALFGLGLLVVIVKENG